MYKNRNQKEYVIHQIKGSRSPQPVRKFNRFESNENDETESDEEYIPRRTVQNNQQDTKHLILEKAEDYALVNTAKNVRLEPNANRISSFIIKEDLGQEEKFHPKMSRSPIKNIEYSRRLNTNLRKYSIRYPYRKSRNGHDADEMIYVKKKIVPTTTDSNNESRFLLDPRSSNPNQRITHHDFLEEDIERPQLEDGVIENPMEDIEFFNLQALKIQTAWKGYNLRLHLFENLNIFYQTHKAVSQLEALIQKKKTRLFWSQFKHFVSSLKKIYIKNNLNLAKIPTKYNTKEIIINFGLRVYRKELNESFQFIRRRKGDTSQEYNTQEKKFINFEEKYKHKVLRQLLILKLNKERKSLKSWFNQFLLVGMIASMKKTKAEEKNSRKNHLLKSIINNKSNKESQQLKKNFLKLHFFGTLKQVRELLLKSNDTIKEANQSKKLIKIVLEKEKDGGDMLRKSFKKYSSKILTTKTNGLSKENKTLDLKKKLHKIVTSNEKDSKGFLKQYFMKIYYNGIFKAMNCQPQKTMEDPKVVLKRKLKKMVLTKESDKKNNLKHFFMKYYFRGISQAFRSSTYNEAKKKPIAILTDSQITGSVQTPKREFQTTKEKRMTMRQLIKSKKNDSNENLRKAFWKFYFTGVFRLMKTSGQIVDRTNPKSQIKISQILSSDPRINKGKAENLQSLPPANQEERNRRLKQLIITLTKTNELILKNAFTIYNLKYRFLKNQKLRESKIKSLVIKKDSDNHKTLVNYFTKFNLKAKLIRIKGILRKNKRRKKKKQGTSISADSSTQLEHSNNPSNVMPETIDEEDDDFNLDDYENDVDEEADYQSNPSPSKPLRSKAPSKPTENIQEGDQIDEITISKSNMKLMIMKHIKLMKIIDHQNDKYLSKYFTMWHYPSSERNSEKSYKASLFIKIISNFESRVKNRYLKTRFNQWKKSGFNMKKNIKSTLAITKLSKIIKKITYQLYFQKFFANYIHYLQNSKLRKAINSMDMRIGHLNNKCLKNRFYIIGKKPQVNFASSVINMMNSFKKVENSFDHIRNTRIRRKFLTLLNRKAAWERPLNIYFSVRKITYYLKNGNIVHLDRNDKILRNFLWRYKNPKKYYFRKYYAKVLKIKERELESQSRKWEYEDFNSIEKKSSPRKNKN